MNQEVIVHRLLSILTVLVLAVFLLAGQARGQERGAVVLVTPFENLSKVKSMTRYEVQSGEDPGNPRKSFTIDRYSEIPRSLLEDMLVNMGVKVVERQRIDQLLLESEFIRLSGLIEPETALKAGRMLGANLLVMGTIVNIQKKAATFTGYGLRQETVSVECVLRVRLVDIERGSNRFSKLVKGNVVFEKSNYGEIRDDDAAYSAIEAALGQLAEDDEFSALFGKES